MLSDSDVVSGDFENASGDPVGQLACVDRCVNPDLEVHVILDNYATHKHEKVRNWLARNPRVHFHFVPTGASWANIVERLFGELDERQLKRLAVNSVSQLIHAINAYLEHRNQDPTPFVWTKSAQEILTKINRGLKTLEALHVGERHRDANLQNSDAFLVVLDTYHDQQTGFVFGTTPGSVEYDGHVRGEGNANTSWDGSWTVASSQDGEDLVHRRYGSPFRPSDTAPIRSRCGG